MSTRRRPAAAAPANAEAPPDGLLALCRPAGAKAEEAAAELLFDFGGEPSSTPTTSDDGDSDGSPPASSRGKPLPPFRPTGRRGRVVKSLGAMDTRVKARRAPTGGRTSVVSPKPSPRTPIVVGTAKRYDQDSPPSTIRDLMGLSSSSGSSDNDDSDEHSRTAANTVLTFMTGAEAACPPACASTPLASPPDTPTPRSTASASPPSSRAVSLRSRRRHPASPTGGSPSSPRSPAAAAAAAPTAVVTSPVTAPVSYARPVAVAPTPHVNPPPIPAASPIITGTKKPKGGGGHRRQGSGGGRPPAAATPAPAPRGHPLDDVAWASKTMRARTRASFVDYFSQEVDDFMEYTAATVATARGQVQQVVDRITAVVRAIWRTSSVQVFGSFANGLWLPSSDVDLVVQRGEGKHRVAGSAVTCLSRLAKKLRGCGFIRSVKLIDSAKVPVLKLRAAEGPLDDVHLDITVDVDDVPHSGIAASAMLKTFTAQLPELKPMVLVLKKFLCEQRMNEPYRGGLSSYSLALMAISYLQLARARQNKPAVMVDLSSWLRKLQSSASSGTSTAQPEGGATPEAGPVEDAEGEADAADVSDSSCTPASPIVSSVSCPASPARPVSLNAQSPAFAPPGRSGPPAFLLDAPQAVDGATVSAATSTACEEANGDTTPPKATPSASSAGVLILGFLDFYGNHFDTTVWGLSTRFGGYMFPLGVDSMPGGITIEDPLFPGSNAAHAAWQYNPFIKTLFSDAFLCLQSFQPSALRPTPLSCVLQRSGFQV